NGPTANLPNAFTYSATPVLKITQLQPASGAPGTQVRIIGSQFQTGAKISFGPTSATDVRVISPTQIIATAPSGTGRVDVTVTNPNGQSFTLPGSYNYTTTPSSEKGGIPWWVWLLIGLIALILFIAITVLVRRRKAASHKPGVVPE